MLLAGGFPAPGLMLHSPFSNAYPEVPPSSHPKEACGYLDQQPLWLLEWLDWGHSFPNAHLRGTPLVYLLTIW